MISSSITGYVYKDNLKGTLKEAMNNTLNNYGNGGIMDLDFDWLQQSVSCKRYKVSKSLKSIIIMFSIIETLMVGLVGMLWCG